MAFDELEEDRQAVDDRLGEDLQQIAVLIAVDQDAALAQLGDGHPNVADPGAQIRAVVAGRHRQEPHAACARLVDGAQDVVGGQRHMLRPGPGVELKVLVHLVLLPGCGLVERELDLVIVVRNHLARERRVPGGDVITDELGHVREALVVEVDPLIHVGLVVADAGLRVGVSGKFHAIHGLVVARRLVRIADDPDQGVPAPDRESAG